MRVQWSSWPRSRSRLRFDRCSALTLFVIGFFSSLGAVDNFAPARHPTLRSDGQMIVDLLRGRP
jgi:hypothetical protein